WRPSRLSPTTVVRSSPLRPPPARDDLSPPTSPGTHAWAATTYDPRLLAIFMPLAAGTRYAAVGHCGYQFGLSVGSLGRGPATRQVGSSTSRHVRHGGQAVPRTALHALSRRDEAKRQPSSAQPRQQIAGQRPRHLGVGDPAV